MFSRAEQFFFPSKQFHTEELSLISFRADRFLVQLNIRLTFSHFLQCTMWSFEIC